MNLKSLYQSFFIKAGRETTFIKKLDSEEWGVFSSKFHVKKGKNPVVQKKSGSVKNVDSNHKNIDINHKELNAFVHPRSVVNEFFIIERFLKSILDFFPKKWWQTRKTFIFQLDYEPEGGATQIELRAIRDALENCGAHEIILVKPSVQEHEIKSLYEQLNTSGSSKKVLSEEKWSDLLW